MPAQQYLLATLGIEPAAEGEAVGPARRSQEERCAANVAAARQFHARKGHLRPSDGPSGTLTNRSPGTPGPDRRGLGGCEAQGCTALPRNVLHKAGYGRQHTGTAMSAGGALRLVEAPDEEPGQRMDRRGVQGRRR